MARHKRVEPMADQYEVTLEQRNFMRRRTAFLLERVNQGPERPIADLLANAYAQGLEDAMKTLEHADRIAAMRAALSAALPVLLEGKREEIARVIDPDGYWERLDSCNHALATVQMNDDQRHALTKVRDDELRCTAESLAKADRIIAMLGGGE